MAKVDFDLDQAVKLPSNYTHHVVRGMHLLMVGERPTWIVLNDTELHTFESLALGHTIRGLLDSHPNRTVSNLLTKIHHAQFYSDDASSRRTYPPKLTLYITNRCNLRCLHCYASAGEALPDELSTEELLSAIVQYSEVATNGEVTISGGEPTLHPDLERILSAITEHGHRSVLFTNGTTNGGKIGWETIGKTVDVIQLSIDGFDEVTNDSIRGKGTFERILKTYELLYNSNVQIRLSVCAMPQNVQSLKEGLLPFLNEYDPAKKTGLILSPTVVAGRNEDGAYAFDYPELQDAIGDALDEIWRSGWRFPNTFQRNDHQPRCGIGSSILIAPDGGYRACTFAPISGNIRQQPLADWYSATQKHLEQFNVDNIQMCKDCDLRHVCLGGCVVKMGHRARCTSSGPCTPSNRNFYYEKLVRESMVLFGEQ
jgi:radical SAM protein with 4Fe4S-binding SPASM domain